MAPQINTPQARTLPEAAFALFAFACFKHWRICGRPQHPTAVRTNVWLMQKIQHRFSFAK
jgi:hypothetical protein